MRWVMRRSSSRAGPVAPLSRPSGPAKRRSRRRPAPTRSSTTAARTRRPQSRKVASAVSTSWSKSRPRPTPAQSRCGQAARLDRHLRQRRRRRVHPPRRTEHDQEHALSIRSALHRRRCGPDGGRGRHHARAGTKRCPSAKTLACRYTGSPSQTPQARTRPSKTVQSGRYSSTCLRFWSVGNRRSRRSTVGRRLRCTYEPRYTVRPARRGARGGRAHPAPRDNEVLVKVHATTVNRTDCGFRGANRSLSGHRPRASAVTILEQVRRTDPGHRLRALRPMRSVIGCSGTTTAPAVPTREYLTMREDASLCPDPGDLTYAEAAPAAEGSPTPSRTSKAKIRAGSAFSSMAGPGPLARQPFNCWQARCARNRSLRQRISNSCTGWGRTGHRPYR